MTGLKDAYRSVEENYLGKTEQVRIEVNMVTEKVIADCEDTFNTLANSYAHNKPRHMNRDCLEPTRAQTSYIR